MPADVDCDNAELTQYDGLLIIAPHPDDEVLGFAGLADAFLAQGKPVRTVVVTDGDAYCEACALWTTGSVSGGTCDALTLSNLATPEVDSLAETRRAESTAAAALLGRPAPQFLGYPDTGLRAARQNLLAGSPDTPLRRSDFSQCSSCGDCGGGYGTGPVTQLNATTLTASLDRLIAATSGNTLIATTHWLDGHGDHAALGAFVSDRAAAAHGGRTVAFAVIHANTAGGRAYADCWYPGPAATDCPCFDDARADSDPAWLASLRAHRERPDWPQTLPSDADYGEASQLCLGDAARSAKPDAISAFATQLGTIGREPGILPASREGMLDCSGYLRSFARRTEVFVVRKLAQQ
jgi:LmbE family N-acetylglucosaminyl deacetylase